ncbi:glycosyltransferase [Cryptosporangium phraense]|uniref:Glycosyltransferase family 4 protein n=1 Tax=Cryptosporangium phraense TaxID=2593070 RepID=A0A545AWA8_9ACTN|nr:glycosyltransferase [Cryptosporangium phraense]TQS45561.1 glycosyltransferase family 4 protein [Cryptosporangium phraense]
MRWLAFGTYDVHRHPRVAVLIDGLREAGDDVVEVNDPLPLDTAGRVQMLKQPWRLPVLAWQLGRCWSRLVAGSRRARKDGEVDAVLVGYLGHFDVRLARFLFRKTPIVLDHLVSAAGTATDRGLAGSGGAKQKLLRWIDRKALNSADVVVVDTPEHLAALPTDAHDKAVVTPVGATRAWFAAQTADRADSEPLQVVFVGLFTPLHGTAYLGDALALLADEPGIHVTMVGKGQDHADCRARAAANPNVEWIDWVAGPDLPAFVASHDVSLGIFGTTAKAQNVVPTKVYQGAAAGCAVVTSDTPPQREMVGEAAIYVPAGDAEALADALRKLAADRAALKTAKTTARQHAEEHFYPARVVAALRDRVNTPVPTRG